MTAKITKEHLIALRRDWIEKKTAYDERPFYPPAEYDDVQKVDYDLETRRMVMSLADAETAYSMARLDYIKRESEA